MNCYSSAILQPASWLGSLFTVNEQLLTQNMPRVVQKQAAGDCALQVSESPKHTSFALSHSPLLGNSHEPYALVRLFLLSVYKQAHPPLYSSTPPLADVLHGSVKVTQSPSCPSHTSLASLASSPVPQSPSLHSFPSPSLPCVVEANLRQSPWFPQSVSAPQSVSPARWRQTQVIFLSHS
jgi:hypothetical protein